MANVLNTTELYALKWFIVCRVNFTSVKKEQGLAWHIVKSGART